MPALSAAYVGHTGTMLIADGGVALLRTKQRRLRPERVLPNLMQEDLREKS
jgi:hypothetical protein